MTTDSCFSIWCCADAHHTPYYAAETSGHFTTYLIRSYKSMQTAISQQPATPCLINSSIHDQHWCVRHKEAQPRHQACRIHSALVGPWSILHLINANARVSKHFRLREQFSMPPNGRILQGNFRSSSDTRDISRVSRHQVAYIFVSSVPIHRNISDGLEDR